MKAKTRKLLSFVFIVSIVIILAQDFTGLRKSAYAGDEVRFGMDGRIWAMLSELPNDGKVEKLLIIRGIYDGLMFGRSPFIHEYYTKTSFEHLITAVDQFYNDYRNQKIPVVLALRIISMELRGVSKEKN